MNKWSVGRCVWEKECSRPVQELLLVKGRKKAQSISEDRKIQRKGCLQVHGPVKSARGAVKWKAGGHAEMLGCLRRSSQRRGKAS